MKALFFLLIQVLISEYWHWNFPYSIHKLYILSYGFENMGSMLRYTVQDFSTDGDELGYEIFARFILTAKWFEIFFFCYWIYDVGYVGIVYDTGVTMKFDILQCQTRVSHILYLQVKY